MIQKFVKLILLSSILNLNVACNVLIEPMPKGWDWGLRPRPLTGVRNFPDADTEYGKGFKDGCSSAWDAVTKGLASDTSPAVMDYRRITESPDYTDGWWDGMEQCVYIIDNDVI